MPRLTCLPGTLDVRLHRDHETVRLCRTARPFPVAEATPMPRPSPATANHVDGFLLGLALSNLFDATDDD